MINIRSLSFEDIEEIKTFTDKWIGKDYFKLDDLNDVLRCSSLKNLNASLGAWQKKELVGIRLTFAPGLWSKKYSKGITPKEWNVSIEEVGYFKSLFIAKDYQGEGLGQKLSMESSEWS